MGPPGPPGESFACPPGFTLTELAVHQREPVDADPTIYVCAA
jgi:hypothetical protein